VTANRGHVVVNLTLQMLIVHRHRVVTVLTQQVGYLLVKVLVNLKQHFSF
jgi:hypothetical protein